MGCNIEKAGAEIKLNEENNGRSKLEGAAGAIMNTCDNRLMQCNVVMALFIAHKKALHI